MLPFRSDRKLAHMSPRRGNRAALVALVAVVSAASRAAADDPTRRGFDPDPVRPAVGFERGFAVESATPAPAGAFAAGVLLDYSRGLLALELGDDRAPLLESRLQAHVLAAWAVGRLELAIDVPFVLAQESNLSRLADQGVTGPLVAPIASSAVGDVRVVAKLPIRTPRAFPVDAAVVLDLRAPTGDGDAFAGDGAMAVPSMVLTRTLGRVRLDGQVGYALRRPGQYAQLVVQDGLTYGLGASAELPPVRWLTGWRAIAELTGGWPRGNDLESDRYRAPLAVRGGLRIPLPGGLALDLGGGTGLGAAGYGRESWRVFSSIRWEATARDRDGDGDRDRDGDGDTVFDPVDLCPRVPGAVELDGCPDFDHDWIPDVEDACPREPGPAQNDGCPVGEEPLVEIETERLSLKDAINFDTGKDTIRAESSAIIDAIAAILNGHADLRLIRVEGHTDNVGSAAYNKDLSQRRAQSVVAALAARGVARERLVPVGFGFERPVAPNTSPLGRAKNRRVEFTIVPSEEVPPT